MSVTSSQGRVVLPEGVTIGAGSETAQIDSSGQLAQGMVFPIKLPGGTTSSVFIPNSTLGDVSAIQALVDARVDGIRAITGM